MSAGLDDAAVFDDDNHVGAGDRAQPVGDDEARSSAHQMAEALLNQPLAFRVEIAGGLVENQQLGVGQDRPGDRQSLPLAAAEPHAAFANHGLHTVGHAVDELGGIGGFGGGADFAFGRVAPRIGDVLSDRAVEQKHILLDNPEQRTKRFDVVIPQIAAVERHAPGRRIIESGNQIAERRLARAAGTDQSHGLARRDRKVDVAQRRRVAAGIE